MTPSKMNVLDSTDDQNDDYRRLLLRLLLASFQPFAGTFFL
jgi:hypothetical protein